MEAIIQQGKSQYRVKKGDVIKVDRLDLAPKKKVDIDKVLVIINGDKHLVGKPYVSSAKVSVTVVEHGKHDKVINFRYRPKKGYHRKVGHRQDFTEIKINKIETE